MSLTNIEDAYPLSPMQQGMLFHSLYAPASGIYVEQTRFDLRGTLNTAALVQAWQHLVVQHSILRTAFVWELEQPIQVVGRQVELPWQDLDWTAYSPTEQQQRLEQVLQADSQQDFDLDQAPLIRLTLIRLTATTHHLIWSHHHLLLDGWSVQLLLQDLMMGYQALCQGQVPSLNPSPPYRNYIGWLQQQDLAQAERFWRSQLQGFTTSTKLWIDSNTQAASTAAESHGQQQMRLSIAATTALQAWAQQHRLTLNTLVQGACAVLLNRYSGAADLVFGATVSGRPPTLADAGSMVGLFINTLPVRVEIAPDAELVSWLQQLQRQQIEARQYEYTPLVDIQCWSDVEPGQPLFETLLVFENYPVDASLKAANGALEIHRVDSLEKTNYPLTLMAGVDTALWFKLVYKHSRFAADTIARLLHQFQTLLESMIARSQQRLSDLQVLTDVEQKTLLDVWNQTQTDYPQNQCLHQLIEAQVERAPDAIAVTFNDRHLTYQELNQRANQLAHYLQTIGIKPDCLVGLCLERSLEMVVGLLAVLKAGGAYVPLDPNYPSERLAFMLQDAQVSVLLTQAHLVASLPPMAAKRVCLNADWHWMESQPQTNPISTVTANHLAYVIYTSGSTGKPKGAMNTHAGVCNRLLWMQNAYQLTPNDRVLQKTPFSFDVSGWEFWWTLMTGARLVVAAPNLHQDSAALVKLIASQQITTLHFVPSMLQVFLNEPDLETCACLKRVMCSGEALSFAVQQRFFARLQAELHNLYGPTEAAIDVTYWQCEPRHELTNVPIGRPIANTQIYLLDTDGNPVPIGVPGELHIGGVGLARGYLNRPNLTAEKFIPHPFSTTPGMRLYKTGDLAQYRPDGTIAYLGRMDHQVKLRGVRIELGEIEVTLMQHPDVRQAVVTVQATEQGDRLVAYIISNKQSVPTVSDLQAFLNRTLPAAMIPAAFIGLDALPLTPNGKLDRKALPAPERSRDEAQPLVSPRTPTEAMLAAIWQEILGLETISIQDNFFALGGHSLLALRVISRLRDAVQLELPLRCLFEKPTLAALAEHIEQLHCIHQLQVPALVGMGDREEIEL